ncbi:hypothetical protein L6452_06436 [Arctium lappa]|uniref:Uncharacterized protein n=1 Tax=Arctium lappa TaxID=4217 RepID=A0ACB9EIX0_ARCLA|nr:hypothetical protein L6452_06436 [Arctium lappa]
MAKLQGDSALREEAERRMKERHDLIIEKPFPEETTPSKEEAEEKKEEPGSVGIEAKSGKRVKSIASKRQLKKPRVEETEKEAEPSVTSQTESIQLPEQPSKPTDESMDPYMTIVEPLKAIPISMQAPEIIFWDILRDNGKNFFRIKRADGSFEAYSTWGKVFRSCSRVDMEELYKVGMKLYEPVLKGTEENLLKVTLEYLCMMFDPERVHHRIKDHKHEFIFKKIDKWILFENCGVYMITIDNCYHEYYLVDKIYEHSKEKLEGMLKATLLVGDCWELKNLTSMVNAAGSELILLEDFKVNTASESSSTLVSKVPMLKPSDFDMWKIRIRQYILLTDYSMWDIIENGPSEAGRIGPDGKRPPPKTDGERKIRQTEMKALSTLLLAIPNEYQHQFCNCTDAQIL